jgi:DNA-directed RNA polymerase subunit beta'
VSRAYDTKQVEISAKSRCASRRYELDDAGEKREKVTRYETTVGRALLSDILPVGLPFELINKALKKKEISRLINASFRRCGCARR